MATRIPNPAPDTVRRHPRTLAEAFPRDHALWHDIPPRRSIWDTLGWAAALVLLLCFFFAPTIWRYFNG